MGDGVLQATVLQAVLDATDLSADTSGEYVAYSTGTEDADWGTDARGNFLSGDLDLQFGAGAGVGAKRMKHQLDLFRDAAVNTDTPKGKRFEVWARHIQQQLRSVALPVDFDKTAELRDEPVSTIISELETLAQQSTQFLLGIGNITEFRAVVGGLPSFDMTVVDADDAAGPGLLAGVGVVRFDQLLQGV